jgi:hypothetical protein
VFNFILNSILITIIIKGFKKKTTEIKLILVLCWFELAEGLFFGALTITEAVTGPDYLKVSFNCNLYGFLIQIFWRWEVVVVCLLSLLRFFIIQYNWEKSIKFWTITLAICLLPSLSIFLYGFIINDYKPSPALLTCFPFVTNKSSNIPFIFATSLTFFVPCWITTFCYFVVGWKCNKQLNAMKKEAKINSDEVKIKLVFKQKLKLILQLALVVIIYNLLFILAYVTMILKFLTGFVRTPILDGIIVLMMHLSVCLNPFITILFQPELYNELLIIFVVYKVKLKSVILKIFKK